MNQLEQRQEQYVRELLESQPTKYERWFNKLNKTKQERVVKKSSSIRHGLTHIAPLQCLGPTKCPFFNACPIPEDPDRPGPNSDYPINMPCVLESNYVAQRVVDYMKQLQVDPQDPIEMSLINELAMMDLMKNRAVLVMSNGDSLGQGRDLLAVDEFVDAEGNTRHSIRSHPAVDILDKLERRRTKLLDKFLATRESKVRIVGSLEGQSALQLEIQKLTAFITQLQAKPLELELINEDLD
jgi:hypothetical protein